MAHATLKGLFAERYMIERELGHGATAVVYLAHDNKHDREIALKVLSKDLAHALGPQRFLREIHVTSRLHHPHILPIFDSGEWEGLLYYVLPFVRGESLRERINQENQLPIEECVRITCEVADALSHAHAQGVVHRDVKPENIMLSDGHALLADFGIARALDIHTGERLTSSGLIVGTSAYMSPEQAAGEEKIDARSDIYSLACVLYEMIAGVQAFTGPTTQSVIAQRFKHTPRPVSTYRPQVPEYLERALEKALAISPADRYSRIRDFAAELPAVSSAARDRRNSPLRRAIHGRQKAFGFAAAALAALSLAFVAVNPPGNWRSPFARNAILDSTKYAVIPYNARGPAAAEDLDAAMGIHRALGKWTGLELVDAAAIADAVHGQAQLTISDALDLARKYGAGKLIRVNGSLDATLYDVAAGSAVLDISREDLKGDSAVFRAAVAALLKVSNRPSGADGGDGRTNSLPAWRAYGRGHVALSQWKIAEARKEFQSAVAADPGFTPARLWSAIINEWTDPAENSRWVDEAIRAAEKSSALAPRDQSLAMALTSLARKNYPDACAKYRALAMADSLDYVAWYGLGECQSLDREVVPSPSSPSGWKFRSSFKAAAEAYSRAVKIDPGVFALISYDKLQRLLPTGGRIRVGPPGRFIAYPSIDHDTLAFVPYPPSVFASLPASAVATRASAIESNLETLLGLVTQWSRALPGSADAQEALVDVLEGRGEVDRGGTSAGSAVAAVGRALKLSGDPIQRARLTASVVRLAIKSGDFERASAVADSLLADIPHDTTRAAQAIIGVAGLTGRMSLASAALLRAPIAFIPTAVAGTIVPVQVREVASALLSHAAAGDCAGARRLQAQLDDRLQNYVSDNLRGVMRSQLVARPVSMSVACGETASVIAIGQSPDRLVQMQQAYARNDPSAVRALFATVAERRKGQRPGDLSLDYTFQEAWLRAAIADTASAIIQLDRTLNALSTLSASTFRDIGGSAALGRTMMLRADIAAARHDQSTARKFARMTTILWRHADPELQPVVTRMRRMAETGQ